LAIEEPLLVKSVEDGSSGVDSESNIYARIIVGEGRKALVASGGGIQIQLFSLLRFPIEKSNADAGGEFPVEPVINFSVKNRAKIDAKGSNISRARYGVRKGSVVCGG